MNLLRLLPLMLIFSMAACQKENIKDIIETPPIIEPDTILQDNAGTFSIDSSQLAVDTAYCFVQLGYDSLGNVYNGGYALFTGLDAWTPLLLDWLPLTSTENKIQLGTYLGLSASVISPMTVEILNNWTLEGEDPNNVPFGGILPTEEYNAMGITITVSNLIDSIEVEDLGNGITRIVDKGTVQLSGSMEGMQGKKVPVSGKFICFFERIEM
jgi:hypothetical protein